MVINRRKKPTATNPAGQRSDGGIVSDIQLLTETVSDLNHSVDFWNQLMLWGLGLTVIAGAFVLVATRMVIFSAVPVCRIV
jgi:hypothetical protein